MRVDADGLHVDGASEVMLLLAAATSFNGFDKSPVREGRDEEGAVGAADCEGRRAILGGRFATSTLQTTRT